MRVTIFHSGTYAPFLACRISQKMRKHRRPIFYAHAGLVHGARGRVVGYRSEGLVDERDVNSPAAEECPIVRFQLPGGPPVRPSLLALNNKIATAQNT